MNEHLIIPSEIQGLISSIESTPTHLAELKIADHPKLPQFDRYIQVTNIDANSHNEFILFGYKQVLKEKDTNNVVNIPLPTPEWAVYRHAWSYLRDANNQPIKAPLAVVDNPTPVIDPDAEPVDESIIADDFIKVPSFKYMIWLMRNSNVGFLQLIEGYLASFVQANESELNAL